MKSDCYYVGRSFAQKKDKVTKEKLWLDAEKTIPDNWYFLTFNIPSSASSNGDGWQSGTVFTDVDTYNNFAKFQPMSYIDAIVVNARGQFVLVKY